MNGAERVDRLISATRMNVQQRVNTELYASTIDKIKIFAESMDINLNIRIVYSPSRQAETRTFGEHTWLIYDQYMGQSMNLLNRIFIEANDDEPAFIYFHKVLSERLLEVGNLNESLHCASIYAQEREKLKGKFTNEKLRDTLTKAQERFYFYHEFGHRIYAEPKLQPLVREQVQRLVEECITQKTLPLDELILQMRAAPPAAYHHMDLEQLINEIRKDFSSKKKCDFTEATLAALVDPEIHEEIFCDILATDLLSVDAIVNELDQTEVLRAIYIGFYHLQAFEYIRRFPNLPRGNGPLGSDWKRDNMPRIQARSHCLKSHLLFSYEGHLRTFSELDDEAISAKIESFAIQLMNDQKRHYDLIFDITMKICDNLRRGNRIAKLGKKAKSRIEPKAPRSAAKSKPLTSDEIKNMILITTGWFHDDMRPEPTSSLP